MRSKTFLISLSITGVLLISFLNSCSSVEEPLFGRSEEIRVNAGIAETTRAVIAGGYASNLDVAFARMDNPETAAGWNSPAIKAVRTGPHLRSGAKLSAGEQNNSPDWLLSP